MGIDLILAFSTRGMTGPGGTEVPKVPHGPVIPRVKNADLKSMPHYRFFFLHTTNFYDKFKCAFAVF